ncbi:MAG: chemotaxis protein CheD [Lachnospiraceae bacterium]|nr:chemotaxis protein CheD [Lachnospiraceae bacterium]
MGELIRVGMADMNICRAPDRITTLGLGSCIGLVLFDINTATCGLIHIMLPDSSITKANYNPAKFADTGIAELIKRLTQSGVRSGSLCAKMAGGAKMFSMSGSDIQSIGEKNTEAVRDILKNLRIPLISSDCGGTYGRTIEFDPVTFRLKIRAIGKKELYI